MSKRQVVEFSPFKDFIAYGVRVGDTLQLSGAVSLYDEGKAVHAGNIVKQGKKAHSRIAAPAEVRRDDGRHCRPDLCITDMGAIIVCDEGMAAFFGMRAEACGGARRSVRT